MAFIKNIALMGTSTALRLTCGLLTFVIIARFLGPDQFGLLMLWLSVATLMSLLANFGFTPYLLREIGAYPELANATMNAVMTAKLMLSALICGLAALSVVWLPVSTWALFAVLLAAQLADSMTEFFNVGYRATNRFAAETRLASISSVLQLALVTIACVLTPTPIMAAWAILAARLITLAITWQNQLGYFRNLSLVTPLQGWIKIKQTHAFASDFVLQSLFGQIDSLVLNHFLGPVSVGVYQAGMRLFNGGAQAATVLANVFLPRIAKINTSDAQFSREVIRVQTVFILCGLAFAIVLTLGAKPLTLLLFGPQFSPLITILPWFGALFLVRFIAASWGIILTSIGEQVFRAKMNLAQWIIVLALSWVWVPIYQEAGWLMSLILGNVFLVVVYAAKTLRHTGLNWHQLGIPLIACGCYVPIFVFSTRLATS